MIEVKNKRGKWLALSHRWGTATAVQLRKANYAAMLKGIEIATLAPKFQDAIQITRDIGLRYLWIESLCIIQDSVDDWELQSTTMTDIYRNAYVTVGAASPAESSGGILEERIWAPQSREVVIDIKNEDVQGSIMIDFPLELGLGNIMTNCLDNRGWCLQEAQLSRRLITFDNIQISYTCLTHGLLESQEVSEFAAREARNPFLPRLDKALETDYIDQQRETLKTWCKY